MSKDNRKKNKKKEICQGKMKVNVQSFRVVHAMLEILSQGTHGLCFFFLIPCECASHNMIWVSESLLSGSCKVYMYDIWIYGWILNMFRT